MPAIPKNRSLRTGRYVVFILFIAFRAGGPYCRPSMLCKILQKLVTFTFYALPHKGLICVRLMTEMVGPEHFSNLFALRQFMHIIALGAFGVVVRVIVQQNPNDVRVSGSNGA